MLYQARVWALTISLSILGTLFPAFLPAQAQNVASPSPNPVSAETKSVEEKALNPEAKAHYDRSMKFAGDKKWTEAVVEYIKGRQIDRGKYPAPCIYCLWNSLGEPANATIDITQIEKDFNDAFSQVSLNMIRALQTKDYSKALAIIDQAVKNDVLKESGSYYYHRAYLYWQMAEWDNALDNIKKSFDTGKPEANRYYLEALCFEGKGDLDSALTAATKTLEMAPTLATGYNLRADLYKKLGMIDMALKDLDQAIKFDPTFSNSFWLRANIYREQGKFSEALSDYDIAIELNPVRDLYDLRVRVNEELRNWDKAVEDYNKLLQYSPRNAYYFNKRAVANLAKGDFLQSLTDKKKAREEGYYCLDSEIQYYEQLAKTGGNGKFTYQDRDGYTFLVERKDGKYHGKMTSVSPEGDWFEEYFENGLAHGPFRSFDKKGRLIKEGQYVNNHSEGLWKEFNRRGVFVKETEYKEGKKNGLQKIYDPKGKLLAQYQFADGLLVDEKGQPLTTTMQEYDPETGKVIVDWVYEKGASVYDKSVFYDERGKKKIFTCPISKMKPNEREAMGFNNQAYQNFMTGENMEEGLGLVDKALTILPKDHHCLSTKAELLYKLGRPEEALVYAKKAIRQSPKDKQLRFDLQLIKEAIKNKHKEAKKTASLTAVNKE